MFVCIGYDQMRYMVTSFITWLLNTLINQGLIIFLDLIITQT